LNPNAKISKSPHKQQAVVFLVCVVANEQKMIGDLQVKDGKCAKAARTAGMK
jgi:hypothetical protein